MGKNGFRPIFAIEECGSVQSIRLRLLVSNTTDPEIQGDPYTVRLQQGFVQRSRHSNFHTAQKDTGVRHGNYRTRTKSRTFHVECIQKVYLDFGAAHSLHHCSSCCFNYEFGSRLENTWL